MKTGAKKAIMGSLFFESGPIMMFDDIIFDLYGTLVDIHTDETRDGLWESMAELYLRFGAKYTPEELKKSYFSGISELERRSEHARDGYPEVDIGEVFRGLFGNIPVSDDEVRRTAERFRELSTDYIRLYPNAAELLSSLKAAGRRVWLLTNAQSLFTRPELDKLGIAKFFDGIYISSECDVKKPDVRFFRRLLTERSIDPERAIMVGNDGAADIEGAKNAGLHTLYTRSNISPDEPTPEADFALEDTDLRRVGEILLR